MPTDTRKYVKFEILQQFMEEAFQLAGLKKEEAEICADILLESDRRGIESHGSNRFKPIYIDRIWDGILNSETKLEIIKDTFTTVVADAHDGMGMVASYKVMNQLIEKAKTYGMAMGVIKNSSHYGIAGYYATMASKQGLIGITGTNARPSIAPTFGVQNMLGTNPLTFAFPTDEPFDFILDCATSIVQRGKIELYARENKPTPSNMVVMKDGSINTDSKQILQDLVDGNAALAPLGGVGELLAGYKGYGYATVVEVLSAALSGGNFLTALTNLDDQGNKKPYHLGHFFIVINPEFFMGEKTFRETTGKILRELRNSEKAPGQTRIYTAGEKEYEAYLERKDKGVPMSKSVQEDFIKVRDYYHMDFTFPFEKE